MSILDQFRSPWCLAGQLLCLAAALLISGCGGGSGSESEQKTASLSFSVQWDRAGLSPSSYGPFDVADCSDVATVSAAVYGSGGALLQSGGPWPCADGAGTIRQVPANRDVQIAIAGQTIGGQTRYRGDSGRPFYLPAGEPYDAGLIVAGSFLPQLTSPADGATVITTELVLEWNPGSGVDHYVVEIADDIVFNDTTILQTLAIEASAPPSCEPDTNGLSDDVDYYWRVIAVDGAGNESEASVYRQFFLTVNTAPVASIDNPDDNSTIIFSDIFGGEGLSCSGSATDLEDGTITDPNLVWSVTDLGDGRVLDSNGGFPITGGNITFDYLFFTIGSYRVTLQATDSNGATGTASNDFRVVN